MQTIKKIARDTEPREEKHQTRQRNKQDISKGWRISLAEEIERAEMYKCESCDKFFTDPQTAVIDETETPFCPYCGSIDIEAINQAEEWRKEIE